jgi:hypothetical protein
MKTFNLLMSGWFWRYWKALNSMVWNSIESIDILIENKILLNVDYIDSNLY